MRGGEGTEKGEPSPSGDPSPWGQRQYAGCHDAVVGNAPGPDWRQPSGQEEWIAERLAPFGAYVTSVVPGGFAAYARILHPATDPLTDDRVVRWAEVAQWSGMPLGRGAQFHSIALPPHGPGGPVPWESPPVQGSLYPPDAEALATILRGWTTSPQRCWFCVWDGFGWQGLSLATAGEVPFRIPDPVPPGVRNGPRVRLPNRDYLLYAGPVEAVTATVGLGGDRQTANLWWPDDKAWCVASEIDLAWTYVGGPAGLIESVLHDGRVEALPAEPHDPLTRVEPWVTAWAQAATTGLVSTGEAVIATSRGTVRAWVERDTRHRRVTLRTESADAYQATSAASHVLTNDDEKSRGEIARYLTYALTGLVEG